MFNPKFNHCSLSHLYQPLLTLIHPYVFLRKPTPHDDLTTWFGCMVGVGTMCWHSGVVGYEWAGGLATSL
ncbi:hypothetical protein D9619_001128 [Psilocybe cf. subviscida]|uniref:Uncharacterized protein n=1 Tax=Psilocybe cf. subviscida TaxID=2480587 RepID=A0A8H5BFH6_9AGAR|nr:hypothetical protein D9619_001128 [Psilocybe cf. subviscida]